MHAQTIHEEPALDEGVARIFGLSTPLNGLQLEDVRLKAAASLAQYGRMLDELFTQQGVMIPPPVHLQWWPEGSRIQVVGGHDEAVRIEALLNGNGNVVSKFKEMELIHEIMHSLELAGQATLEGQHFNFGMTSSGPVAFFTT